MFMTNHLFIVSLFLTILSKVTDKVHKYLILYKAKFQKPAHGNSFRDALRTKNDDPNVEAYN